MKSGKNPAAVRGQIPYGCHKDTKLDPPISRSGLIWNTINQYDTIYRYLRLTSHNMSVKISKIEVYKAI